MQFRACHMTFRGNFPQDAASTGACVFDTYVLMTARDYDKNIRCGQSLD